jgi:hypothetical protein
VVIAIPAILGRGIGHLLVTGTLVFGDLHGKLPASKLVLSTDVPFPSRNVSMRYFLCPF